MTEAHVELAVGETAYLLARWRVTISERGCSWIVPAGDWVSPEELAGLLALLKGSCDDRFPRAVVFDFGGRRAVGEQWSLIYDLLQDFARTLGARCRIACSPRCSRRMVIIARCIRDGWKSGPVMESGDF